jgi:hypothetical protein
LPVQQERNEDLIQRADALNASVCATQRELFRTIVEIDRRELWEDWGAQHMAHWVSMRYGISSWKAMRWVDAAHALENLPLISRAFSTGQLGIDKVVELTRFARPETEEGLILWAQGVSCGAIRHRGDLLIKRGACEVTGPEESRSLTWSYFDEGRRFGLEAELPAAEGAVVAKALDRLAAELPAMPGEDDRWARSARRADALVGLCSGRVSSGEDPDRATVIVHAPLESFLNGEPGCEVEGDGVIPAETARRLACTARVQVVVEDSSGQVIHLGRIRRDPPAWMMRQLRYRDRECVFPSCGSRRWAQAHHITWWEKGGTTDLENLALVCFFHHKLVHEHGWRLVRDPDGAVRWFHPDGTRYRAGPDPPSTDAERSSDEEPQAELTAAGF